MDTAEPLISEAVRELIALASAAAASHTEAFQVHFQRGSALGIPREELIQATNIGLQVKKSLHGNLLETAQAALVGNGCSSTDCSSCEGGCGE